MGGVLMKLLQKGKTKDLYRLPDGNYLLKFKDDVTGEAGVFDPGANEVGLTMPGAGKAALALTRHFFQLLTERGVATHFLAVDLSELTMKVQPAIPFGEGLEVICRYRAVGSFYRRYGKYVPEGAPLAGFIEFTLKDDARKDPPIGEDALVLLGIMSREEWRLVKDLTHKICGIVRAELARVGADLYDIKLEFGRIGADSKIALIDEISGGNMRVYKDGVYIEPLALARLLCGN